MVLYADTTGLANLRNRVTANWQKASAAKEIGVLQVDLQTGLEQAEDNASGDLQQQARALRRAID